MICWNCNIQSVILSFAKAEFRTGGLFAKMSCFIPLYLSRQCTDVCRAWKSVYCWLIKYNSQLSLTQWGFCTHKTGIVSHSFRFFMSLNYTNTVECVLRRVPSPHKPCAQNQINSTTYWYHLEKWALRHHAWVDLHPPCPTGRTLTKIYSILQRRKWTSKTPFNISPVLGHSHIGRHLWSGWSGFEKARFKCLLVHRAGALGQWLAPLPFTPEFGVRFPVLAVWKKQKMFLPHPRVKVSIVGSLRDREVVCSASDRQGSNFESCVWRTVSSQSSHHPQEVLRAQFSLYVHKGGLRPDSFHFICGYITILYWHTKKPEKLVQNWFSVWYWFQIIAIPIEMQKYKNGTILLTNVPQSVSLSGVTTVGHQIRYSVIKHLK